MAAACASADSALAPDADPVLAEAVEVWVEVVAGGAVVLPVGAAARGGVEEDPQAARRIAPKSRHAAAGFWFKCIAGA